MPLPALAALAVPHLIQASASIFNNCVNSFNNKLSDASGRTLQRELEEKRRETELKIAYAQMASEWKLEENRQDFQAKMQADRQQFEAKLVEYQCQENRKLQEFIKAVDVAIAKSNQEFQAWLFYQEKDLQRELAEYNLQGQLKVASYQRETARELEEYRVITENFPISLTGQEIIDSHGGGDRVPLRVIISPPTINPDEFAASNPDFPDIEADLSQGLKDFVEKYYPLESNLRPAEFFSGVWRSKKFRGTAAVKRLFHVFKSEPFLILESEPTRKGMNLNLAYWSGGQLVYSAKTVFSKLPYGEILSFSANNRALESEAKDQNKSLALNKTEAGMSDEDIDKLCQFLTAYHNLLVAFFADVHYLIHYNLEPQLPQLLLEIVGEFIEDNIGASILQFAVDGFLVVFKALETDRPALIPDLSIDFAIGLLALPDKSFAQKVLEYSVVSWLKARSLSLGTPEENLTTLEAVLVPEDVTYAGKLNRCLAALENNRRFSVIESCYQRGLRNCKEGKSAEGIVAFTQAIYLNSEFVDAYYNRGLAYGKTEKYRKAIADYSRVIELQPIHAQAVNNRGNAYYKLGEYEAAINDFDRAVNLGLEAAAKNRDIAKGVWNELKRKQRQEEEEKLCRQREEEERKLREEREKGKEFTFEIVTVNSNGKITNRRQGSARQKVESLANNVTLEMVYIPGGTFTMGSTESSSEQPQHQVKVPPFYLGKYPVTQAQYHAVMGKNPSSFKGEKRPVEKVTWHNAVQFCQNLSQKTGKTYRLPSEAEWEYACRAGTTTPFYFGETLTSELANYNGNYTYASGPKGVYREKTTDVGSFPPNAFGLYDMHGNVWEWCQDVWHDNYNGAPTDGSAWESGGDSSRRMQRGGSWYGSPWICRSAGRNRSDAGYCFYDLGFRVVLLPGV